MEIDMKRAHKWLAPLTITLALSATTAGLAQDRARDRARDPAAGQDRVADRDRVQDRDQDRITDRDRIQDRDQVRDQDRDRDRDRDRLQLHVQDRDQLRDRDIYGSKLMTREERKQYRDRIVGMKSVREWAQFRAEHQKQMMARARERGADLPAPLYGQQLMTDQERERLQQRLREANTEQERERIRNENRERMQQRARENQIPLNEIG
jgi:hypothetical protein